MKRICKLAFGTLGLLCLGVVLSAGEVCAQTAIDLGRIVVSPTDFEKLSYEGEIKTNYAHVWNEKNEQIFAALDETNQQTTSNAEFERTKFTRELLSKEIQYRRERMLQIFSWASSTLIAIIGGIIALSGTSRVFVINKPHKWLLFGAVLILVFWSCLWIDSHSTREEELRRDADNIDKDFLKNIRLYAEPISFIFFRGPTIAVILIGVAAGLVIYYVQPS